MGGPGQAWAPAFVLLLAVACGPATSGTSEAGVTSSGAVSQTGTTSTGASGTSEASSSSTTGPILDMGAPPCTPHPVIACELPAGCPMPWHGWSCGGESPFDASGCSRPACFSDADCEPDGACIGFNSGAHGFFCVDDTHEGESRCICGSDPLNGDDTVFVCIGP